jgi:hypothetical protein
VSAKGSLLGALEAPHGSIEVEIETKHGWVISATGPRLSILSEYDLLRTSVADAAFLHDWDDNYAIVTEILRVKKAVIVAARGHSTTASIALGASVPAGALIEARFGVATKVVSESESSLSQVIDTEGTAIGIRAKRVRSPSGLNRYRTPLGRPRGSGRQLMGASRLASSARSQSVDEFWVDLDGDL